MTEQLRFGIVGAGYMAKLHSLALRNIAGYLWPKLPRIEMVRVADLAADAAQEACSRWGWRDHTDDWRNITRGDDIDVVIIITPNDSHCEIAVDALRHAKHVFCEKPLANTTSAAEEMARVAAESGKVNLVNFSYRTWPAIELARQLISEGRLGQLLHFDGHFFQDYAANPALPFSWRFDRAVSGGGAFGDIGSHIVDIAAALMGPVVRVAAKARRLYSTRPVGAPNAAPVSVDDLTMCLAEFQSGALGGIHASWAAPGFKSDLSFSVVGTMGSIRFSWERCNELHLFETSDPQRTGGFRRILLGGIHPGVSPFWYAQGQGLGYGEAFVITLQRCIEGILANNSKQSPNFAEALHVSRVIQAAFDSAETAAWVDVPA